MTTGEIPFETANVGVCAFSTLEVAAPAITAVLAAMNSRLFSLFMMASEVC
jgi:hypothetical protein